MRVAFYSDIHAQLSPLEAVLEAVEKERVDWEIAPGDLVMGGPEPAEVLDLLMKRPRCIALQGNFDRWVVDKVDAGPNGFPNRNDSSRLTREHLSQRHLDWLKALPQSLVLTPELGHNLLVFHGTPDDDEGALPLRLTDAEVLQRLKGAKAEVMAFGQVHGPYVRKIGNQTLIATASAAVNWDGDNRPAYVIVEYGGKGRWNIEIKRVAYDFEAQAKKNDKSWDPGGDKQAKTLRTGYYWNPAHMPH